MDMEGLPLLKRSKSRTGGRKAVSSGNSLAMIGMDPGIGEFVVIACLSPCVFAQLSLRTVY